MDFLFIAIAASVLPVGLALWGWSFFRDLRRMDEAEKRRGEAEARRHVEWLKFRDELRDRMRELR